MKTPRWLLGISTRHAGQVDPPALGDELDRAERDWWDAQFLQATGHHPDDYRTCMHCGRLQPLAPFNKGQGPAEYIACAKAEGGCGSYYHISWDTPVGREVSRLANDPEYHSGVYDMGMLFEQARRNLGIPEETITTGRIRASDVTTTPTPAAQWGESGAVRTRRSMSVAEKVQVTVAVAAWLVFLWALGVLVVT